MVQNLSKLLDLSYFSGLQLNQNNLFFVGFELSVKEEAYCFEGLGIPIGYFMQYLFLPPLGARLSKTDPQPVVKNAENRLEGV